MKSKCQWLLKQLMAMVIVIVISPVICGETGQSFCTTDIDKTRLPSARSHKTNTEYFGELSLKLSVYYDNHLFELHKKNVTSVQTFINKTISSIALTFKQTEIERVAKINFWIQNIELLSPDNGQIKERHDLHNAENYLKKFCNHSNSGLIYSLFTGYDILGNNLLRPISEQKSTQGVAFTRSLCTPNSCFLVEATNFKAAIVSAHEIGHILGMSHDFNDDLNIMNNSTGRGKTKWSQKSVNELKYYFNELKNSENLCLENSNKSNVEIVSVTIDEQCRQMFGPEFVVYHEPKFLYNSICQLFWCRSGPFVMKGHMALQNTPCSGTGSYCFGGQCYIN